MVKPRKKHPVKSADIVEDVVTVDTSDTDTPLVMAQPLSSSEASEWRQLVQQLPDAMLCPTQRWYGETFYPTYTTLLVKLRKLANE